MERRVRIAGEHGLGLDVVLYFTLKPAEADFPRHERYLREVARRLGRYANVLVYEIANEHVWNEGFQDRAGSLLKALDPRRPLDPRARELLQTGVAHVYREFVGRTAAARNLGTEQVDELAQGRVWTGRQAHEHKLVDRLGRRLATLAGAQPRQLRRPPHLQPTLAQVLDGQVVRGHHH